MITKEIRVDGFVFYKNEETLHHSRYEDKVLLYLKSILPKTPSILDIGCSNGISTYSIWCHFPTAGLAGLDILPGQIELAKMSNFSKYAHFFVQDVFKCNLKLFDMCIWEPPWMDRESTGDYKDAMKGFTGWDPSKELLEYAERINYKGILCLNDGGSPTMKNGEHIFADYYLFDFR